MRNKFILVDILVFKHLKDRKNFAVAFWGNSIGTVFLFFQERSLSNFLFNTLIVFGMINRIK